MTNDPFSKRLVSFGHAWRGIVAALRTEWNMRFHAAAAVLVVIAGFIQDCSRTQWLALIGAIAMVMVAELLNTALERLCDYACEGRRHPLIKAAKDIAAGAALLAAIAAAVTGALVFWP